MTVQLREGQAVPESSILHVDMDAFYASVSLVDRPELHGQPVIIGGGQRGVVLSATYEARAFGVHSAMPMARARRLCPEAVVVRPDHDRYAHVSRAVMELFRQVTPLVEPMSVDEAFLDVTGASLRLGGAAQIGEWIRATVADEQGITCSVGIAPTKFVAKVASGQAKPDGLVHVRGEDVVAFLHPLPVGVLWGVGPRTQEALARFGLERVVDVAHTPVPTLQRILGPGHGQHLHDLAWGHDARTVQPARVEHSVGSNETFGHDVDDPEVISRQLLKLADRTAARARSQGVMGRTVVLTVRFSDFTTITRSRTLPRPTDVSREIHACAQQLYDGLGLYRARIRLLGVRLQGCTPAEQTPVQALLTDPEHGWREADRAVDRASARFGAGAVRPASLLRLPADGGGGRGRGSRSGRERVTAAQTGP